MACSVMVAGVSTGHPAHLWGHLSEGLMLIFVVCIILSSGGQSGLHVSLGRQSLLRSDSSKDQHPGSEIVYSLIRY